MLKRANRFRGLMLCIVCCLSINTTLAQATLEPRLQISVSLLPGIVTANKTLAANDQADHIPIYLVYRDNSTNAELIQMELEKMGSIRNRKLEASLINFNQLPTLEASRSSILFITEPLKDFLPGIVDYSDTNNVLVFSPFKGDVELGVTTGLQVTDKVLPAVNMKSLRNAQIELKAFFLRIAVKYD